MESIYSDISKDRRAFFDDGDSNEVLIDGISLETLISGLKIQSDVIGGVNALPLSSDDELDVEGMLCFESLL